MNMKKVFIGINIYFTTLCVVLGVCGAWPLLIIGTITGSILYYKVIRIKSDYYILDCMGVYYLEKLFPNNPLCKNEDE